MALKFNGTTMGFGLRWYNTANGEVTEETYKYPYLTEAEFSRNVFLLYGDFVFTTDTQKHIIC